MKLPSWLLRSGWYIQRSLRIGKVMLEYKGLSTYGVKVDMFRYAVLVGRLSSLTFVSRERWDYIRIDYFLNFREKSKDRKCSQWSNSHTMEEWH
ncbi:hypothetical protein Tco_1415717 [Tanacetum coccineum]